MKELPQWHETDVDPESVVGLREIADSCELSYAALRSYATYRREHKYLGRMPAPVARVSNRKAWLRSDISYWLAPLELPRWRRNKAAAIKCRALLDTVGADG